MFEKSDAGMLRTAYELSAGMLSFVVAIALGAWFGHWLDGHLHTTPWLAIVFGVFGLVAGVLNVVRTVSRAIRPQIDPGRGPSNSQRADRRP